MILLFNLNVRKQLAKVCVITVKNICIVSAGNQLFRTDAIGRKEVVIFLIRRIPAVFISAAGTILFSLCIVTVTGRYISAQCLLQRLIMLLLILL